MAEWYVTRNNERYGPYTWDDMRRMAGDGNVVKNDLVWSADFNEWKEAVTIPGLFGSQDEAGDHTYSGTARQEDKPSPAPAAANRVRRKSRGPVYLAVSLAALALVAAAVFLLSGDKSDQTLSPLQHQQLISMMSADQAELYSHFGSPEQYLILFEYNAQGSERMETWTYPQMQFYYTFLNGTYIDGDTAVFPELVPDSYGSLLPVQFKAGMKPADVARLVAEEGREMPSDMPGQKILYFGNGELTCLFNGQELLIAVYRSPAVVEGGP